MKNILCVLGFHKPDKYRYLRADKYHKNGTVYHRNYVVCERCGKRLFKFGKEKKNV